MIWLKQSTASQEVPLGPFVDASDGFTAEDALTIANTDIKLWKSGATTLANKNSGGATHIATGNYYTVLDATDTATVGPLVITVQMAGARPVRVECMVAVANVYDSIVGGTATLEADMTKILGTGLDDSDGLPDDTTFNGTIGFNFSKHFGGRNDGEPINDISSLLLPTVAGRTLDVTATGAAGIDWSNIENKTTTVDLANTTFDSSATLSSEQDGWLEAVFDALPVEGLIMGAGASHATGDEVVEAVNDHTDDALDAFELSANQPIGPDRIVNARTWFADGYRARNIVEVLEGFEGTLALAPDLNPDTAILSVVSATVTGPDAVTTSSLTTSADRTRANFNVDELTVTGTYTAVVTVTTTDGQEIPTTATLKVN